MLLRQSMAQPSLCGHQQQQACNTIRGTGSRTTGLRPVTPRLVVGNGLRPFCVDSEFGLGLGLGFNPKIRLRRPCRGLCYTVRRPLLLRRKGRLSCSGLCYTVRRPLLLRRKGRLSVLMIRFRWVRSKPFAPSSKVWLNPAYVVINNNKPVIL